MKGYKDLEIYNLAFELAIKIRLETLKLPNYDKYEVGGQLRRSSQSIKDNIVEGCGRRRYKADFIKFLTYSYASLQEAKSQTEFLARISESSDEWNKFSLELDKLGIKIYNFICYVEKSWNTSQPRQQ